MVYTMTTHDTIVFTTWILCFVTIEITESEYKFQSEKFKIIPKRDLPSTNDIDGMYITTGKKKS